MLPIIRARDGMYQERLALGALVEVPECDGPSINSPPFLSDFDLLGYTLT